MITSELVPPRRLSRKAVIYMRQSSPYHVLSNQESLRPPYAPQPYAQHLDWPVEDSQFIGADLGQIATSRCPRLASNPSASLPHQVHPGRFVGTDFIRHRPLPGRPATVPADRPPHACQAWSAHTSAPRHREPREVSNAGARRSAPRPAGERAPPRTITVGRCLAPWTTTPESVHDRRLRIGRPPARPSPRRPVIDYPGGDP